MAADLHSLTYFSRNLIRGTEADLRAEIVRILDSARRNNPRRNITGALLFTHGCFAQVLEGEFDNVEASFTRIQRDPRHADVRILQFEPIKARMFADWSMAFAGADGAEHRLGLEGLLHDPSRVASGEAGRLVIGTLSRIIGKYDTAAALL